MKVSYNMLCVVVGLNLWAMSCADEENGVEDPMATSVVDEQGADANNAAKIGDGDKDGAKAEGEVVAAPEGVAEEDPMAAVSLADQGPAGEQHSESAATTAPAAAGGSLYVTVSHLNVRDVPSMNSQVVDIIKAGTAVSDMGRENRIWVRIGDGRYVSSHFLSDDESKRVEPPAVAAEPAGNSAAEAVDQETSYAGDSETASQEPAAE